ncbi:hypothetical protein E3Q17_00141 [Wallemia mellicola]|uniref:Tafazzin family protein n=1 Tax=Wallemia mellicola TaxID=1708541 RepID=A0A4T0R594_9BASI|nr:hypothetical protein E3Q19_00178 [Wallemia mellicola]TIC04973.1 hypothetical protein E3Q17_00141 [Wallemia mellicola]TIC08191.1 hypothetical protein E3Q16_00139 [Wallemia mellicola]TIC20763.1 hypothetical protein E3Q13_00467 [Wallemia mellicola]TIC26320.1 hypothetical protein E3Q12_00467 [Wallemia mellicola]
MLTVSSAVKLFYKFGTHSLKVRGLEKLTKALSSSRGVLTITNHRAVGEDPLWPAILPLKTLLQPKYRRWTLGASDVIFTNAIFRKFFQAGQVLETYRGNGVDQPAVYQAAQLLDEAKWVSLYVLLHITSKRSQVSMFPEGRINVPPPNFNPHTTPSPLRPFRWGVGRMLTLTEQTPTILPIHLTGFNDVFKDGRKYTALPSTNARITVDIGDPINWTVEPLLEKLKNDQADEIETRKEITEILRKHLDDFGKTCDIRNYEEYK